MIRSLTLTLVLAVLCSAQALAVTFEWARVSNPGNAGDAEINVGGTTGYGAVDYSYRISKYAVTNAQYTEFLNAVDPPGENANLGGTDPFSIQFRHVQRSEWRHYFQQRRV